MTTMTDVNESFATERTGQIRSATDARADFDQRIARWPNSSRPVATATGSTSPAHGTTARSGPGRPAPSSRSTAWTSPPAPAALYTAVPAWHGLGSVIPGGISDIDEVLRLGRIDFDVQKSPVLFRTSADAPDLVMPEKFVTFRTDTGAGLGVVGSRYTVLGNRQVFEFLQDLVDDHGVTWESAGALRDGRSVFVSMRLPKSVRIDADGVNDEIIPFIVAMNSHDGTGIARVVVTPWRPVCANTERFAVQDAQASWGVRHTRNAMTRVEEARRTLGLSVAYFDRFAAEEETLARTDLAVDDWQRLAEELWPTPEGDAAKRAKTIHENKMEVLGEVHAENVRRLQEDCVCSPEPEQ